MCVSVSWSPADFGWTWLSLDVGCKLGPGGPLMFLIILVSATIWITFFSCPEGKDGWNFHLFMFTEIPSTKASLMVRTKVKGKENIPHAPWGQNKGLIQVNINMAEWYSKGRGGREYLLNNKYSNLSQPYPCTSLCAGNTTVSKTNCTIMGLPF